MERWDGEEEGREGGGQGWLKTPPGRPQTLYKATIAKSASKRRRNEKADMLGVQNGKVGGQEVGGSRLWRQKWVQSNQKSHRNVKGVKQSRSDDGTRGWRCLEGETTMGWARGVNQGERRQGTVRNVAKAI
jgi:hypothetical protein